MGPRRCGPGDVAGGIGPGDRFRGALANADTAREHAAASWSGSDGSRGCPRSEQRCGSCRRQDHTFCDEARLVTSDVREVVPALARTALFGDLDAHVLDRLARMVKRVSFPANALIFQKRSEEHTS